MVARVFARFRVWFGLRQIRVRFGLLGLGPFRGYWVGVVFGLSFG